MTARSNFSAADAALGYLYQVSLALLSSLQRLARNEIFAAYIETLDDVVFDHEGSPLELLQLKHHRSRTGSLSNASPDLWKSFRIWMEGRSDGTIPPDAKLYLITTNSVISGTSASYLMLNERNESEALKHLEATVSTSTNQTNEEAYRLFRDLSDDNRRTLVNSVVIVPNAPNITDVNKALRDEARLAVKRGHLESFVTRLEGWWYARAVRHLVDQNRTPILSSEIEGAFDDIREQFKSDSLPVDQDILNFEVDSTTYEDAMFVRQIILTGVGGKRILTAVRDYYRAFEQRSRWIREDLLYVGELDSYEQVLREAWEIQFDRISDEIGEFAAEEAKRTFAQRIYAWVEDSCLPIRPGVQHPSMTRGSFHILSDRLHVGWHPEFMQRLQNILEPQEIL